MNEIKVILEVLNNDKSEAIKNILHDFIIVLGTCGGVIIQQIFNNRLNREGKKQKVNNEIKSELETFYYPMIELLRKNRILYDIFTNNKNDNFRTLVAIINGDSFSLNDKSLIREIIKINNELNSLIFKYKHILKEDIELSKK